MTAMLEVLFWLSGFALAYPYVIYPVTLWLAVCLRGGRPVVRSCDPPRQISVIIAAFNEERHIGRRIEELLGHIAAAGLSGEIVVVSDGSTDRTAEIAGSFEDRGVRSLPLPENQGKAIALTQGCSAASGEVLVFADARQTWSDEALTGLLANFADPSIGAVSGDLVLAKGEGVLGGVGLYWRFEKWLRKLETKWYSNVGVTGAISAVRRSLFTPIPAGTILDDVYWPLRVAMGNHRVVHEAHAVAHDRLPDRVAGEFRRKVRTQAGNYQLIVRLPSSLLPWRNPIWWPFLSHKVARLLAPWGLVGLLITGALLGGGYRLAFWVQVACYALAMVGLISGSRSRSASAAASFLVLNAAAWMAFWVWISGRTARTWTKVGYANRAPVGRPGDA